MTQWFAKITVVSVRDALQSHKAVSANPLGFVRAECFESTALLLAVDGALKTKPWSAYMTTTAWTNDLSRHLLYIMTYSQYL